MKNLDYPLLFKPVYKDYPWGGRRIPGEFGREVDLAVCAESWEVADRPEGMSVVANGPLAGTPLRDLVAGTAASLGCEGRRVFPLLIKIIDAKETLSVQVHPDEATAPLTNGEAKTEMWVVLDAEPGAGVYAGLKPGVDEASLREALRKDTVADCLNFFPVKPGEAIFIPGGLVHAIGKGCLLLEIQQNSNTTYRVYDWGRMGNDGCPRELHVEQAMKVISWTAPAPSMIEASSGREASVVSCPFFICDRIVLEREGAYADRCEGFRILFLAEGSSRVSGDVELKRGTTCLIPPGMATAELKAGGEGATLYRAMLSR